VQLSALIFQIPLAALLMFSVLAATVINGAPPSNDIVQAFFLGCLIGFFLAPVHLLLPAIAYPRKAEVEIRVIPSSLIAFICSQTPLSKTRHIVATFLPLLVFGVVPFILWVSIFSQVFILLGLAFFSMMVSACNIVEVISTIKQVPRGGVTVASGRGTYWCVNQNLNAGM
jgi:hypothetical protein